MWVVNWLDFKPINTEIEALALEPGQSLHIRLLARNLVRNCLVAYPWQERKDLVLLFDPSAKYNIGQVVALPVHDKQGIRPDSWRVGKVKMVYEGENRGQGKYQVLLIIVDNKDHWLAASIDGASLNPLQFPPDEDEMDFVVDDIVNHYLSQLIQVVDDLISTNRLPAIKHGERVIFGIEPKLKIDISPWFKKITAEHPFLTIDEITLNLKESGELNEAPKELARILIERTLQEGDYVNAGSDRWTTPSILAELDREISRRLEVPRNRSIIKAQFDHDEELENEDYYDLTEPGQLLLKEMEVDVEEPHEPRSGAWKPPTTPIKMPALSYLNIMQGFFPLNSSLIKAFPPHKEPGWVEIQIVDGKEVPFIVNFEKRELKSFRNQDLYQKFVNDLSIPAGTFLWLEYRGENRYRIAPQPLPNPRLVHCKQAWLEDGLLRVEETDIEMRFEGDEYLFRSELRHEDVPALFHEAAIHSQSIFDAIYDVMPKLAHLRPDGLAHYKDIFNAVFFEYRMCSYHSVIHELYDHACFEASGNGFFRFSPEKGLKRRRPSRRQVAANFWKPQPILDGNKDNTWSVETTFWRQIATEIPRKLHTLDEQKPFEINIVTHDSIELIVSTGQPRTMPRREVEQAWNELIQRGKIDRQRIAEFANFNVAYLMAILVEIPGVSYRIRPLRLLYNPPTQPLKRSNLDILLSEDNNNFSSKTVRSLVQEKLESFLQIPLSQVISGNKSVLKSGNIILWMGYSGFNIKEGHYWFGIPKETLSVILKPIEDAFIVLICEKQENAFVIPVTRFVQANIFSLKTSQDRWLITIKPNPRGFSLALTGGSYEQKHIDINIYKNAYDLLVPAGNSNTKSQNSIEDKNISGTVAEKTRSGQFVAPGLLPKEPLFAEYDDKSIGEIKQTITQVASLAPRSKGEVIQNNSEFPINLDSLKGRRMFTLRFAQPFFIGRIDHIRITIGVVGINKESMTRQVTILELVKAWKQLTTHGRYGFIELFQEVLDDSAYIAAILSTHSQITFDKKNVELIYHSINLPQSGRK